MSPWGTPGNHTWRHCPWLRIPFPPLPTPHVQILHHTHTHTHITPHAQTLCHTHTLHTTHTHTHTTRLHQHIPHICSPTSVFLVTSLILTIKGIPEAKPSRFPPQEGPLLRTLRRREHVSLCFWQLFIHHISGVCDAPGALPSPARKRGWDGD